MPHQTYTTRSDFIAASVPQGTDVVRTFGYLNAGDGGSAIYKRSSAGTGSKSWQFTSADGAWWELAELEPNILMYGASISAPDNTAAIQEAIDYTAQRSLRLHIPTGTFLCSQLIARAYTNIVGASEQASIIKLRNGANTTLFVKENDSAYHVSIERVQFNGSRASNSIGDGVDISGVGANLRHVAITQIAGTGLIVSAVLSGQPLDGLGHFAHIQIENTGGTGFHFASGADYRFHDMHINNPSLNNNSGYGIYAVGNGRWTAIHVSNADSSGLSTKPTCGTYIAGRGNDFSSCHFECGATAATVAGDGNQFSSCRFYAPDGQVALLVIGSYNHVCGSTGIVADSGYLNYGGLQLGYSGFSPIGNMIVLVNYGGIFRLKWRKEHHPCDRPRWTRRNKQARHAACEG
jgi:hypothetical protein